jgi:phosphoglycerate dehydrogenase-like enzyme
MKILIYDPYISDEEIQKYGQRATLEEVLRESNFISLHCTVTEETRGMIGKEQFALMRKDAFLINTSRAVVTDREALIEALQNKKIAGAALDVYHEEPLSPDDPILKLDNAFITPHIGGATFDVERHQSRIILTDILRWLEGKQPVNVANPEVLRM